MFLAGRTVCTNGFSKKKKMITKKYKEIIRAAKAGGEVAKKYFGKALKIEGKSMPADFRTKADLEAEKAILKILRKKFPKYNIISEEAGETVNDSEYTFVIDPIDGTYNFVLGIPYFSCGGALLKGKDIIFGVVYESMLKKTFWAEKGKGAYQDGKKLHVNKESDFKNCSVCYARNYHTPKSHEHNLVARLESKDIKRFLRNWSILLDLCRMAAGKIEAMIIYGDVPLWDVAAGKLIAMEAGAAVTDYTGGYLISNGTKIHKEILKILE